MSKTKHNLQKRRNAYLLDAVHVALPVMVDRFDAANMSVDVQPLIKTQLDGEYVDPPLLLDVRIATPCYSTCYIRPWYQRGDYGLVLICDADIDAVLATGAVSEPGTPRLHALEDAFFVGAFLPSPAAARLGSLPDKALVLGMGGQQVVIRDSGIDLRGNVTINGRPIPEG